MAEGWSAGMLKWVVLGRNRDIYSSGTGEEEKKIGVMVEECAGGEEGSR